MDRHSNFARCTFVPGFRVKFQTQNQNGKYQNIPATETYELNQAKEAWKLNVQLGNSKISGKLNSFLENGKTSVFFLSFGFEFAECKAADS